MPMLLSAQCLGHSSGEVRMAAARAVRRAARSGDMPVEDVLAILPALVSNAKEKSSPAKLAADLALVSLLRLHGGDSTYQVWLSTSSPYHHHALQPCIVPIRVNLLV